VKFFDTAADTVMDTVLVEHVGDLSNLSYFLPVGPVWCIGLLLTF